ncbi:hypothetical protein C9374_009173 [Naegleria lovaniensis]|uniref:FAD/NAD(P)-binding domain-containing protein n=1 Tax=Naegleria lovaniensis TaxID=51637 RepID=A0AA88GHV3_NAELO|nr:uncharacterized protein C9374_009173 [Naegleria lovaniensis]KAG2377657.1 hypothetical protein C9374_009173 [Naegleria lovaniensis]
MNNIRITESNQHEASSNKELQQDYASLKAFIHAKDVYHQQLSNDVKRDIRHLITKLYRHFSNLDAYTSTLQQLTRKHLALHFTWNTFIKAIQQENANLTANEIETLGRLFLQHGIMAPSMKKKQHALSQHEKNSSQWVQSLKEQETPLRFLQPFLPRMILLGGGDCGIGCAKNLSQYFSLIMIDRSDTYYVKPAMAFILEDAQKYLKRVCLPIKDIMEDCGIFIQGEVQQVTEQGVYLTIMQKDHHSEWDHLFDEPPNKNEIVLSSDNTMKLESVSVENCHYLTYDYLVVATGTCLSKNTALPKMLSQESTRSPNNHPQDGEDIQQQGMTCVENQISFIDAYSPTDIVHATQILNQLTNSEKTVLLVGGGYIGVEFACALSQSYPHLQFILVQRSHMLMRPFTRAHEFVSRKIESKFQKNLKVLLNSQVIGQSQPKTLIIETRRQAHDTSSVQQQEITCSLCFMCCGFKPNSEMMKPNFSHALNSNGYIQVNSHFQVLRSSHAHCALYYQNIFALGDVNTLDQDKLLIHGLRQVEVFTQIAKQVLLRNLLRTSKKKKEEEVDDEQQLVDTTEDLPSYMENTPHKIILMSSKLGFMMRGEKVLFSSSLLPKMKHFLQKKVIKEYKKKK